MLDLSLVRMDLEVRKVPGRGAVVVLLSLLLGETEGDHVTLALLLVFSKLVVPISSSVSTCSVTESCAAAFGSIGLACSVLLTVCCSSVMVF